VDFRPKERYNLRVMKILIATGIYPPRIGGPAQYAKNLKESFERAGHEVFMRTYGFEHYLPTGIRHLYFLIKIIAVSAKADYIIALDTFSVGFPAVLVAKLLRKKIVIRTGGDFLWEGYVERTKDLVLLKDFYSTTKEKWNWKERMIFKITRWTLHNVSKLVFSTSWQEGIFSEAYDISKEKSVIIENFYGQKISNKPYLAKTFIVGTRPLAWKNIIMLKNVFQKISGENPEISLDDSIGSRDSFIQKIENGYAVILVSLGDISPNMILDAISCNKPFILTRENGIYERIKNIGIFVDPKNENEIKEKVLWLADPNNYAVQKKKIEAFSFTHSWEEIRDEFIKVYNQLI